MRSCAAKRRRLVSATARARDQRRACAVAYQPLGAETAGSTDPEQRDERTEPERAEFQCGRDEHCAEREERANSHGGGDSCLLDVPGRRMPPEDAEAGSRRRGASTAVCADPGHGGQPVAEVLDAADGDE